MSEAAGLNIALCTCSCVYCMGGAHAECKQYCGFVLEASTTRNEIMPTCGCHEGEVCTEKCLKYCHPELTQLAEAKTVITELLEMIARGDEPQPRFNIAISAAQAWLEEN